MKVVRCLLLVLGIICCSFRFEVDEPSDAISPFFLSVQVGSSGELSSRRPLRLLLDINRREWWIFAELIDQRLSFASLRHLPVFSARYTLELDGFEGRVDGFQFDFPIGGGGRASFGVVFRADPPEVDWLADGVVGMDVARSLLGRVFSTAVDRTGTRASLAAGIRTRTPFGSCGTFAVEKRRSAEGGGWAVEIESVYFGHLELASSRPSPVLLSTLSPWIAGPRRAIERIFAQLGAAPNGTVDCARGGPPLVFRTAGHEFRVPFAHYSQEAGRECALRLLPAADERWVLGRPFHVGRCAFFDEERGEVGFADLM
ncbi:hypothetical protein M3Y99_01443900 [Aphelenchoides fujianensis]|nr:hypothetical protein M3Y99_01443900 [Aphelenchoides fujianensis]